MAFAWPCKGQTLVTTGATGGIAGSLYTRPGTLQGFNKFKPCRLAGGGDPGWCRSPPVVPAVTEIMPWQGIYGI